MTKTGLPRVTATLLLEHPPRIDYERLVASIGPALGITKEAVASAAPTGPMIIPMDGDLVVGLTMDIPYPADLSALARFAHWWPSAIQDIGRNRAHMMISSQWSKFPRLEAHMRHMVLVRELVDQLPVIGVLWGSVLTPADNFKGEFALAAKGQIPVLLWVLIQYSRQPNGNTLISTLGMRDFGHMEIETESSLPMQETYDLVRALATHVIGTDRPIPDNDTFGLTAEQRIKVRHTRSFRPDVNDTVYWLELARSPSIKKPTGFFSSLFGSRSKN